MKTDGRNGSIVQSCNTVARVVLLMGSVCGGELVEEGDVLGVFLCRFVLLKCCLQLLYFTMKLR